MLFKALWLAQLMNQELGESVLRGFASVSFDEISSLR
jgi:hypothetical protein